MANNEHFFPCSAVLKNIFCSTMDDVRKRLCRDANLRLTCGFSRVPSLSTFSRRMSEYAHQECLNPVFTTLVRAYTEGNSSVAFPGIPHVLERI